MPAVVIINEWNGASVTTDKTSGTIRFKNAANASVDTDDRLTIPATGHIYSFKKWLRAQVTSAPDVDIQNLEAYSDGGGFSGNGSVKVWGTRTEATYSAPAVPASTNDPPQHDGSAMLDFFVTSAGATWDLNAGTFTGTGHIGNFLILVMEVEAGATQGTLTAETLTFEYDET